jgi:L-malate glycosyltransferase
VVATRVGGTPDVLRGGAHGLLVGPGDPRALADAVVETLRDPTAAQARALNGRSWVLGHHAAQRLVDDVDRLYRELLRARAA